MTDEQAQPYRGIKRTRGGRAIMGQMADTREAWVDMPKFQAVLFVGHDEDWLEWKADQGKDFTPKPDEPPPVRVQIRIPGRRYPTNFALSGMTVPELKAFKAFMDMAFEKALPSCEYQDAAALKAYEEGDDSFARIYRPIPKLLTRQRVQSEHPQGLPSGPARHLLDAESRRRAVEAVIGAVDGDVSPGEQGDVGDEDPQP